MALSLSQITAAEWSTLTADQWLTLPLSISNQIALIGHANGAYTAGATCATAWAQAAADGIHAVGARSGQVWTPARSNGIYTEGA